MKSEAAEPPKPEPAEDEKLRARAAKFGLAHPLVEKEKRKQRALRFGLPNEELESEKKKQRALRFGLSHPELEAEKKKQREQRFGIPDAALPKSGPSLLTPEERSQIVTPDKLQKRAEKFKADK